MYNSIFCSTNKHGAEGISELSEAKKRGVTHLKGSGIKNKFFNERIDLNNASNGFYDMVQLIYAKTTNCIWMNSLDSCCLEWQDLDFLFNAITENDCALHIENDQFSPLTKRRRKQLLELYRKMFNEKPSAPQQIGRNKNVDEGKQLALNSYGYDYKKNADGTYTITKNKNESLIVRDIFSYYCDGKSLGQIVKLLSGISTKENSHFTKQKVKNILSRPEYSGYTYNSSRTRIIKSKHYASIWIITKNQSDTARLLLRDNSKPNREPQIRSFYSGLVFCKECMEPYFLRKPNSLFHKNSYGRICSNTPKNVDMNIIDNLLTIIFLMNNNYFSILEKGYRLLIANYTKQGNPLLWAYFSEQKRKLIQIMKENKTPQKYVDKKIAELAVDKRNKVQKSRMLKSISQYSKIFIEDALKHIPTEHIPAILGKKNSVVKAFIKAMCEKVEIDNGNLVVTLKSGKIHLIDIPKRYEKPCFELRVLHFFQNGIPSKYDL
jgi:hypothetical protein